MMAILCHKTFRSKRMATRVPRGVDDLDPKVPDEVIGYLMEATMREQIDAQNRQNLERF